MKRVAREQILSYAQWEAVRPVLRPLFINEKERRRLAVGEHVTLLFENAQSVWYQVEEMLRVERITDADAVQHELDTYNALVPGAGELSATLLIQYPELDERDAALRGLAGFERHLWLKIGDRRIQAEFDTSQIGADAVSAVQFVRFAVGGSSGERFVELAAAGAVTIEVDHPHLRISTAIAGDLARALAADLRDPS
jgi:hypothetical protein